ncbi:Clavaminate synthase-like protein [Aspergillus varians]
MKPPTSTRYRQVYAPLKGDTYYSISSCDVEKTTYASDHQALRSRLVELCSAELWYGASYKNSCPRPILITPEHDQKVKDLHCALVLTITDIVGRWWIDKNARFPERMPLEAEEEGLLRWMDSQGPDVIPPFAQRLGSWRPDFLVEEDSAGKENIRITEINARFPFNGFMHLAYGVQALADLGVCGAGNGLVGAADFDSFINGMLQLFRPGLPVHLLKGEEPGIDIHMVVDYAKRHLGFTPRLITPADLRLFPDEQCKDRMALYCVVEEDNAVSRSTSTVINDQGERLEKIHQVGLELHQRELFSLSPEMLRQLSTRCFNDLRTVLLVHDKRMLGIVKQELRSMVARNILTPSQADALDSGIADTILPGSPELMQLTKRCKMSPDLGAQYIRKPVRSGKGNGIVFGEDLNQAEWVAGLESLNRDQQTAVSSLHVIQRRIRPILYDVALTEVGSKSRSHVRDVAHMLETSGILKVTLQFEDKNSDYLRTLIQSLHQHHGHGLPITHSASRGWFWDVRPTAPVQTAGHLARSETMQDFPWHTDCSYETLPPRFFALHVLQHDRCSGGTLSVIEVNILSQLLSASATAALQKPHFRITTPPEFVKDNPQGYIVGSLLAATTGPSPHSLVRFREDIVTPLDTEGENALKEMREALTELHAQGKAVHLTASDLPSGSIWLMDNYRWLHMRSEVRDLGRHLRRVRWDARPFPPV